MTPSLWVRLLTWLRLGRRVPSDLMERSYRIADAVTPSLLNLIQHVERQHPNLTEEQVIAVVARRLEPPAE